MREARWGRLPAMTIGRQFAGIVFSFLMVLAGGCGGEEAKTAPTTTTSSSTTVTTSTTTTTTVARTATTVAVTRTTAGSPATTGRGAAVALCNDGTYSYAADHQAECSSHGGVAELQAQ
jgi:hypothetical protein